MIFLKCLGLFNTFSLPLGLIHICGWISWRCFILLFNFISIYFIIIYFYYKLMTTNKTDDKIKNYFVVDRPWWRNLLYSSNFQYTFSRVDSAVVVSSVQPTLMNQFFFFIIEIFYSKLFLQLNTELILDDKKKIKTKYTK